MSHTFPRRRLLLRVLQSGAGEKSKELRRAVVSVGSFEELLRQMKRVQRHRRPLAIRFVLSNSVHDSEAPGYFQKTADRLTFELSFGGYREVEVKMSPRLFPLAIAFIQDTKPFGGGLLMAMGGSTHAW